MTQTLPDWRNFGVMLRVLLGANLLTVAAALVRTDGLRAWPVELLEMAAWVEPVLLAMLAVLALARDALWHLPIGWGRATVVLLSAAVAWGQFRLWTEIGLAESSGWAGGRAGLFGAAGAGALLAYFDLRARAYSPALVEARLMALNARIRPHFLFNSINAVLSLIRAEPRRAEAALETVSDLFRAALRDPGEWLPISQEIALCRQYLELEKLRLGDRLQVHWDIRDVPLDAPIPPLMLQPLVENAVYHGIEPAPDGGRIDIVFERHGEELRIGVINPRIVHNRPSVGHHMALANIRERLALYFDLEARLEIEETETSYRIAIHMPCRMIPHRSIS